MRPGSPDWCWQPDLNDIMKPWPKVASPLWRPAGTLLMSWLVQSFGWLPFQVRFRWVAVVTPLGLETTSSSQRHLQHHRGMTPGQCWGWFSSLQTLTSRPSGFGVAVSLATCNYIVLSKEKTWHLVNDSVTLPNFLASSLAKGEREAWPKILPHLLLSRLIPHHSSHVDRPLKLEDWIRWQGQNDETSFGHTRSNQLKVARQKFAAKRVWGG